MGKVVNTLYKRVDVWCESTGVHYEFRPGDVGEEPARCIGYRV